MPEVVEYNLYLNTRIEIEHTIQESVRDVFENRMRPDAKAGSPVDTGNNRDGIDTEVTQVAEGIQATLYTTSGYGGYLEIGTSKMDARPYIGPAVDKHIREIAPKVKAQIG